MSDSEGGHSSKKFMQEFAEKIDDPGPETKKTVVKELPTIYIPF